MRRVILQDAVLYLTPDSKGRTLSNSLFTSLPHIFDSTVFTAFKSELLQAIALHRQNSTVLNPSVSMDKQDVSNAMNTISSQVSQGQIALEQRMDRMSRDIQDVRDVQKTMAAILPSTLEHTQYSPWHPYPRAPYPVQSGSCPSSHPCQSCLHPPSCPHPLYPHLSYTHPSYFHPAYLWPPYQQYIPYRGLHPSPHRQPISSQPTRQRRPQLVICRLATQPRLTFQIKHQCRNHHQIRRPLFLILLTHKTHFPWRPLLIHKTHPSSWRPLIIHKMFSRSAWGTK
ncbi:MAG: hypothetical protein JOS17DRAFT_612722 [Linnemannia elongata]|nr:MAG: hypothetical protein JOS17DRAFT_612722 [Linnemannia elongata]